MKKVAKKETSIPALGSLMTVSELAKYLRLDRQTVYRMVREKTIPCLRAGFSIRFDKAAIDDFLVQEGWKK